MVIVEEIWATLAMALPSFFSIYYILTKPSTQLILVGTASIIHYPWSACLHLCRAFSSPEVKRVFFYKMDIAFQHIYCVMVRHAFVIRLSYIEWLFHLFSIFHVWHFNPIQSPQSKDIVSFMAGLGLGICVFSMYDVNKIYFGSSILFGGIGFFIHIRRLFGNSSSLLFHILLCVPHYCVLMCMLDNKID